MKKTGASVILILLILSLLFGALAEDFKPKEPSFVPTELPESYSFKEAAEIEPGLLYIGQPKKNYHFKFIPEESGEYHFYLRALDELPNDGHGLQFGIFDLYDNYLKMNVETYNRNPVVGVFELTAGEEYRFNNDHYMSWGHFWGKTEFYFAFCSPSRHAGDISELEVIQEPTCTEPGYQATRCLLCGGEVVRAEIPATGHTPGEPVIYQDPTCLKPGLRITQCTVCGAEVAREEVPVVDHQLGAWEIEKPATCTSDGQRVQQCTVCGAVLAREDIPATGHQPGVWVDLKPVTCTADGQRAQRCAVCGETLNTETMVAFGHSPMEWQITREAGCLQSGLREKKCAVCGISLEQEEIPALGHSYTEWETTIEATKDAEGERSRHCIHCGDTQFETIEKVPKFLGIF